MAYPLTLQEQMAARAQGRALGLTCGSCGAVVFPAKSVCTECGARDLSPVEVEGRGVVRTFTVIRVAPAGFQAPFVVAMVELAQGPWVVGRLAGVAPEDTGMALIGRPVSMEFEEMPLERYGVDQCFIPIFKLLD